MKKYPVTSKGVEYCAEIVTQKLRIGKGVSLYLNDEKVYSFHDSFLEYKNDYIGMVKEAVRRYEKRKSDQEEEERIRKECIRKLEEWDGDCRE